MQEFASLLIGLVFGLAFGVWLGWAQAWQFALKLRRFAVEPFAWQQDDPPADAHRESREPHFYAGGRA